MPEAKARNTDGVLVGKKPRRNIKKALEEARFPPSSKSAYWALTLVPVPSKKRYGAHVYLDNASRVVAIDD